MSAQKIQLPEARILLEAIRLANEADIPGLKRLVSHYRDVCTVDHVLRILLSSLPESTEASQYTGFLRELLAGSLRPLDHDPPPVPELEEKEARHELVRLYLEPLPAPGSQTRDGDALTAFLLRRAHRIDDETGSLPLVRDLLEPFLHHSEDLRTWMISTLLPLLRLDYEYYPEAHESHTLDGFASLSCSTGLQVLLAGVAAQGVESRTAEYGRDLRGLVGPWLYGTAGSRPLPSGDPGTQAHDQLENPPPLVSEDKSWSAVNEWLLRLGEQNFWSAANAMEQWEGPRDVDYGGWDEGITHEKDDAQESTVDYAQLALALLYTAPDTSPRTMEGVQKILNQITNLLDIPTISEFDVPASSLPTSTLSTDFLDALSPICLLRNELLAKNNSVTRPSEASTQLASLLLLSAYIVDRLGYSLTVLHVSQIRLFGTEVDQRMALQKLVHAIQQSSPRTEQAWISVRDQLLWLQSWTNTRKTHSMDLSHTDGGVFGRISRSVLDLEILKLFLTTGQYQLATRTYCHGRPMALPADQVEKAVLDEAFMAFDGASNGNKTRGGVKKALDILMAFHPSFPTSTTFDELGALISATHALSFYSLTLQHGVPFQPVSIRAQTDAISLIEKVLAQNPQSYTSLDDLLDIGRHLVHAGLVPSAGDTPPGQPLADEDQVQVVERRIIARAIEASLQHDDFDTAYSYAINRLSPAPLAELSRVDSRVLVDPVDELVWRAVYHAGQYQTHTSTGPSGLRRLEQRMELLSHALLLAPLSSLGDVLTPWRACEAAMNVMLAEDMDEHKPWDDRERPLPGTFAADEPTHVVQTSREPPRSARNDDAPMGLFDVARGAAAALRKSAFPLRGGRGDGSPPSPAMPLSHQRHVSGAPSDVSSMSDAEGTARIRKRDQMSSMVTGGLASGIGWVLGAPPVRQD